MDKYCFPFDHTVLKFICRFVQLDHENKGDMT